MFRWLCQWKVAPNSYDLVDNFGCRSPKELPPGVERLARGQRVMTIFEIADFRVTTAPSEVRMTPVRRP